MRDALAIKVRRQAAFAVGRLLESTASRRRGASIKTLTLAPSIVAKKATYAVSCETLKYLNVVRECVEVAGLLEKNAKLRPELAYVLVYEILIGEAAVAGSKGAAERAVTKAEPSLRKALAVVLRKHGAKVVEDLLPKGQAGAPHPRYARVNTLKATAAGVIAWLADPPAPYTHHKPRPPVPEVDSLLPDLLVFPPGTDLHDHPLVRDGTLLQQGKASCLPAHALAPEPGWHVVDACAAPGNKTTHVAALMGREGGGKVTACEKDNKRIKTLRSTIAAAAATHVEARRADFLSLDPLSPEFSDVRGLLLDPSCSGSGTANTRMDHLTAHLVPEGEEGEEEAEREREEGRVEKLALFQEAALRHALKFPALRRLSYSTCSVHRRENEEVVARVMADARKRGFRLAAPFPAWPHRGLEGAVEGAECLVRCEAERDLTDGFFVAVFERDEADCGKDAGGGGGGKRKKKWKPRPIVM